MTIKAILWTYEKRTDGTADVKIYTYPPKKYHTTGIKIKPGDWDKKKGRVKNSNPLAVALNAKITRLIDQHTKKALLGRVEDQSLVNFLELFLEEIKKGMHPIRVGTAKNYQSTLTRLKQFCKATGIKDVFFSECSMEWHAMFSRWLADFANCNAPGLTKHTKILKRVLRTAQDRDLHDNSDYKRFTVNRTTTSKIYLRTNEIEALQSVDLSGLPHLERERDRFLVSYFLLMRYGDSVKINKENAYQDGGQWFYRYVSEKTTIPVVVPIKPAALKILVANAWNMGEDTNQEANRHIKQVAAMAGINEPTKEGEKKAPKWRFVTTHTARRSAATNMALEGVQIDTIAKLGGWDKIATLKSYLRASGIDVARAAAKLDFFQ